MDDQSFDRLARVVSDLRDRTSRRGALKALLGGALAVPALTAAGDAAEGRRRRNRRRDRWWDDNWGCRYTGQYCSSNRQCCNGSCRNSICGGYNYPGGACHNTYCPVGWKCKKVSNGVHVCMPEGSSACCNGACWPDGYKCCRGGACPGDQMCCGNGSCCPSGAGWRCRNGQCWLDVNVRTRNGGGPVEPTPTDWSVATPIPDGKD